jgi:predicted NAD-dependent protein-ADP-ribosyltransferase YbiA (DUF1768 family)
MEKSSRDNIVENKIKVGKQPIKTGNEDSYKFSDDLSKRDVVPQVETEKIFNKIETERIVPETDEVTIHVDRRELIAERGSGVRGKVPEKVVGAVRYCQICDSLCSNREYPDMFSEQEGKAWNLCANCLTGFFPSLHVPKFPTSGFIKVGDSPSEFLWELSPRSCHPVRFRGMTWPSAYHAVAAEMFDGDSSMRMEILKCFDAEEVDALINSSDKVKKMVRSDWNTEQPDKLRRILLEKSRSHPLIHRLLYSLAGKRVVYRPASDTESLILGKGDILTNVIMELIDDAATFEEPHSN